MRLILTILLIGLFKADAQMVINASSPYRPIGITPILDAYSNASYAYSLRKIRTAYAGAAIRVRKDTTGQPEQDIGFIGNELDTAALKSFLNARNGFVTTWYDQSGNDRNSSQTTQANQPRIANLGVIERRQGKVTIFFDGSNDRLQNAAVVEYAINSTHHYAVSSRGASLSVVASVYSTGMLDATGTGFGFFYTSISPNNLFQQVRNTNVTIIGIGDYANTINVSNMIFGVTSGTADSVYYNGGNLKTQSHTRSNLNTNRRLTIGARSDNANAIDLFLNGSISEIVRWATANAPDRNAVFTNVNSYYSIW